jgi:hypothetical protein
MKEKWLAREQRKEVAFVKQLGVIAVITGLLYYFGFLWRTAYYVGLGVHFHLIEYPFPEILVPRGDVLAFGMVLVLAYKFFSFRKKYKEGKSMELAGELGTEVAPEVLLSYLVTENKIEAEKKNMQVLTECLLKYLAEKCETEFDLDDFVIEAGKRFPDLEDGEKAGCIKFGVKVIGEGKAFMAKLEKVAEEPRAPLIYKIAIGVVWVINTCVIMLAGLSWLALTWGVLVVGAGVCVSFLLYTMFGHINRFRTWNTVLIVFLIFTLFILIDAVVYATSDRINRKFPIAKIERTDGEVSEGYLLGKGSGGYIIKPLSDNRILMVRSETIQSITTDAIISWTDGEKGKVGGGNVQIHQK